MRFGVNPKTVAKWRCCEDERFDILNRPGFNERRIVGRIDEWRLVRFRISTSLSIDDCLYGSQSIYPWLTRSTLYRIFRTFGISRLSELTVHQYLSGTDPAQRLGICSFYITRIPTDEGMCDIHAMIDHATKLHLMKIYRSGDPDAMVDFHHWVERCFPFPVHTILMIADTSCADRQDLAIELGTNTGATIKFVHQPLNGREISNDLEESGAGQRQMASLAETRRTIGHFLLRYNFERKIMQNGGLRPAEAAERYTGTAACRLRRNAFEPLLNTPAI